MKDFSKEALEASRQTIDAMEAVEFCLRQLFKDKKKKITDEVATRLTYEELIGALLLARDHIKGDLGKLETRTLNFMAAGPGIYEPQ